jgi:hypothetical protein
MNINMSGTDVDYIDPALAYGTNSWQVLDAACAKLVGYPDKPGVAGTKLVSRCRSRVPDRVEGREDVHGHDQASREAPIRSGAAPLRCT